MPSISIVIPCFNEAKTIEAIVDAVLAAALSDLEIIVVDDGSTDGTAEVIANSVASKVQCVVTHETNRGKGAALRSGFKAATEDLVQICNDQPARRKKTGLTSQKLRKSLASFGVLCYRKPPANHLTI